jgi:type VI secretion system secreted protein VgrG
MTASEQLGGLFQLQLDLLSQEPDIAFEDILGQDITVRLALPNNKKRYFNGYVSHFSHLGTYKDYQAYGATVQPWFWFLTRTADCRIFQERTVPDIIKSIFKDHGFSDYEESLSGQYRTWQYCVQYRETDFNFVSRLMEQEGIYYYFKHENKKHIMVLSDSVCSHQPYPGYEQLPYYPPDENLRRERDHIYEWNVARGIQPGSYALNDFDFTRPKANIEVKSAIQRSHARGAMEVYDYPGEYCETSHGESYARARIEELQKDHEQIQGQGNARGIAAGSLFSLTGYAREDQNREYLVVSATHQVESDAYATGPEAGGGPIYSCSFTVLESQQPFRPPRDTLKPAVQGPQTAIVVGPAGEEIYTDKYSRVKVSFHWDRYSQANENSSCWIRVAQVWAGKQWGGIYIPRIGQEVIVEFLEGDPDRPIITGRVYNNDNMPPYTLPANATQSGIKSRSSKGANAQNFNELRFEDKKGAEEIHLHGEKDWTIKIKNDKKQTIDHDDTLTVTNNRTKTIGKSQSESIGDDLTLTIGKKSTVQVGTDMALNVGKTLNIDAVDIINITSAKQISFSSGAGSIAMNSSGDITISGSLVTITGSTDVVING